MLSHYTLFIVDTPLAVPLSRAKQEGSESYGRFENCPERNKIIKSFNILGENLRIFH